MDMPTFRIGKRIYRKLRYRKGYSVHSPFVYNLITKVIEEKSPYYIFDDIEKLRVDFLQLTSPVSFSSRSGKKKKNSIGSIVAKETQHRMYGALLFRLSNYFQCRGLLHVGASAGIMTLYMVAHSSACRCIALETRPELNLIDSDITKRLKTGDIRYLFGPYQETIREAFRDNQGFDLIFIDTAYDPELTRQLLDIVIEKNTRKETVLMVDGIKKNETMSAIWKEIIHHPKVTISIDLYAAGLIFFKDKIYKQHFKAFFDDGKK